MLITHDRSAYVHEMAIPQRKLYQPQRTLQTIEFSKFTSALMISHKAVYENTVSLYMKIQFRQFEKNRMTLCSHVMFE